jgi:hypothetical protein
LARNETRIWNASLPHISSHCLPRGQVFVRNEARNVIFSERKRNPTLRTLSKECFIYGLAYQEDIFNHMNEINPSVQDPEVTIICATEQLQALLAKLSVDVEE